MHWAASHGNVATIIALIKSGADPRQLDNLGKLPLDITKVHNTQKIIAYLQHTLRDHDHKTTENKELALTGCLYKQLIIDFIIFTIHFSNINTPCFFHKYIPFKK